MENVTVADDVRRQICSSRMVKDGPPSPQPSPPGRGCATSALGKTARPSAIDPDQTRRTTCHISDAFVALPLLGERAGARASVISHRKSSGSNDSPNVRKWTLPDDQCPPRHLVGCRTVGRLFQILVAAEVTRLKHPEDQSLLTSAATATVVKEVIWTPRNSKWAGSS